MKYSLLFISYKVSNTFSITYLLHQYLLLIKTTITISIANNIFWILSIWLCLAIKNTSYNNYILTNILIKCLFFFNVKNMKMLIIIIFIFSYLINLSTSMLITFIVIINKLIKILKKFVDNVDKLVLIRYYI